MTPPTPVILLPPSEAKDQGGDGPPVAWDAGRFGGLADSRCAVRDAVRRAVRRRADAERLLGVTGAHLDRALVEWVGIDSAPTMPAAVRYSGVVWGALDIAGMNAATRRRLMARVVVPSGLWGLVGAGDAIPPYRLKMGARVGSLGLLSRWWRPRVSPQLAARAGRGAVIDLLPQEHSAGIDLSALRHGAVVRVEIVEDGPAGRRSVGHAGKQVKGRLARAILDADIRTADDLADLRMEGLAAPVIDRGGITTVTFPRLT
jgi:uncharacterized protein